MRSTKTHASLLACALMLLANGGITGPPPNEAGRIMVLMYHRVGQTESTWVRTRQNFTNDLESLYKKGYRPISLRDMVRNRITTPAGLTPVVLTFDDGWPDQFRVVQENDRVATDPKSAVGILEQFHREHPDFPLKATFFLYGNEPFGQKKWVRHKLNHLISRGMDIGNHTLGHNNLGLPQNQGALKIQRFIGDQARFLESMLVNHPSYRIDLYSLCNGRRPVKSGLRKHLVSGTFKGHDYRNIAILNVGGGPSFSPATRRFNPLAIKRIRASNLQTDALGLDDWLAHFDNAPRLRYVSDGDPDTVTVPRAAAKEIDPDRLRGAKLVLYDAP